MTRDLMICTQGVRVEGMCGWEGGGSSTFKTLTPVKHTHKHTCAAIPQSTEAYATRELVTGSTTMNAREYRRR